MHPVVETVPNLKASAGVECLRPPVSRQAPPPRMRRACPGCADRQTPETVARTRPEDRIRGHAFRRAPDRTDLARQVPHLGDGVGDLAREVRALADEARNLAHKVRHLVDEVRNLSREVGNLDDEVWNLSHEVWNLIDEVRDLVLDGDRRMIDEEVAKTARKRIARVQSLDRSVQRAGRPQTGNFVRRMRPTD